MLDPNLMSALGHPARLQALVLFEQRPASAREVAEIVELSPNAMAPACSSLRRPFLSTENRRSPKMVRGPTAVKS
jgi:hypothetical protein